MVTVTTGTLNAVTLGDHITAWCNTGPQNKDSGNHEGKPDLRGTNAKC